MTTTVSCDVEQSISLEEYVNFCDQTPNLNQPEVCMETAFMLRKLANNRQFLVNFLNLQLQNITM